MTFKTAIYLSCACLIFPIAAYLLNFSGGISSQTSDWSNFGSYIGGLISSIFSFLSFLMVLLIYYESQKERTEREVESRVFKYIDLLNSNFSKIKVSFNNQTTSGNDVFQKFYSMVFQAFRGDPKLSSDQIKGMILQNQFFKNAIEEYVELIGITCKFIQQYGGKKKQDYLTILLSQLSETQKASFGILKYEELEFLHDFKQRAYKDSPLPAYIMLGEKLKAFMNNL